MKTQTLFVYGSWAPGYVHYARVRDYVRHADPATVRGSLYRSAVGFPLYVHEGDDRIHGSQLTLEKAPELAHALKDFPTLRVDCLCRGQMQPTEIFATLKEQIPKHWPRIARGDWEQDLKRRPDLVSRLSPRQLRLLERLRASNGLNVAAEDLALYRELLRLDLIVDSGRQMGLSALGHELVRYLPEAESLLH